MAVGVFAGFCGGYLAAVVVMVVRGRPASPPPPSLRQIRDDAYLAGWNDATSGRPYREGLDR